MVAAAGAGRIACHFDRNTFFYRNGAGTDLHRLDNTAYARNLSAHLPAMSAYTAAVTETTGFLQLRAHP